MPIVVESANHNRRAGWVVTSIGITLLLAVLALIPIATQGEIRVGDRVARVEAAMLPVSFGKMPYDGLDLPLVSLPDPRSATNEFRTVRDFHARWWYVGRVFLMCQAFGLDQKDALDSP